MTGPDFKTSQETSGPNELIMQFMAQSSTSMIRVGIPNNNSNWNNPGSFRTSYSSAYNNSAAANSLPENFDFDLFIQFTRSATAEKRESAAKAAAMALERLDNQSETDMNHYIEALEELLSDFEDVQTMTLDKIYTIFNTTQKAYPELWEQLNQRIPKLVIKALRFSSQTQNSAINAITKLIEENLLTQAVIQTVIIPSLFDFVADFKAFQSDDPGAYEQWFANRVQVASVLCKVANSAEQYPKKWIFYAFLPKYSHLFTDKNCVIRKLAISAIGTLSRLFGADFTEKGLVPHLVVAVEDENYRVRKLCCDVFVELAKNCSFQIRSEILTPKYLLLMNDSNKNVYYSAMQQLGPFIATFADPNKTGVEIRDGRVIRVRTISGSSRKSSTSSTANLNTSNISLSSITSPSPTKMNEMIEDDFFEIPKGFRLPGEELAREEPESKNEFDSTGDTVGDTFDEPSDEPLMDVENENDFNKSFADVDPSVEGTEPIHDESKKQIHSSSNENHITGEFDEPSEYPPSIVFELTDEDLKIHEENFFEYIEEIKAQKLENHQETGIEYQLKAVTLEENEVVLSESGKDGKEERKIGALSPTSSSTSTRYWSFESSNFDLESELEAYSTRSSAAKQQIQITTITTNASNGVIIPKLNLELDVCDTSTSPQENMDSPKIPSHMDSSFWQRRFDLLKDSVQELVRKKKPKSLSPEPKSPAGEQGQKTPVRRTSPQHQHQGGGGGVGTPKHLATVSEDEEEKDTSPQSSSMMSSTLSQSLSSSLSFIRAKARLPPLAQLREPQKSSPPPPTPPQKFGATEWGWNDFNEPRRRTSSSNSLGPYGHIISSGLTEEECQYIRKNKQDIIPHALLDCLLGIEVSYDIEQQEVVQHLARNFPAIAFTLGQRNWVYLKGFYQKMANHFMLPVRATLARSMHEIAQIIGSELTDKDLVPIFENFLKDEYEVQLGLLNHLYDFYKMVSPSIREHLATQLGAFIGVEGSRNWRLRHDLAEQCIKLCRLYSSSQINDYISCYAMTFANDSFAEVRKKGVELLAEVLSIFIRDEWTPEKQRMPLTEALLNDARRSFFKTTSWRRRQSWGHVLETILRKNLLTPEQFFDYFANDLLALSKDSISQVRLTFCHVMKHIDTNSKKCQEIREMLQNLEANEEDMEIQLQAKFALGKTTPHGGEVDLSSYGDMMKKKEEKMWHAIHEYQRAQFGVDFEKKGFKNGSPSLDRKSEGSPSLSRNQNISNNSFDIRMKTYVSLAEPEPDALDFEDELEEQEHKAFPSTSQDQKMDSQPKMNENETGVAAQSNLNEAMKKLLADHNMSEEEFVEFIRNYGGKSSLHEAVSELKEHVEKVRGNEKLAKKSHEDQKLDEQDQEIEHVKEIEEPVQFVEEHDKVEENEEVEDSKEERVQTENVQIKVASEDLVTDDHKVQPEIQDPIIEKKSGLGSEV